MKLLFDQNISFRVRKQLTDIFPGCKHVSDCGLLNSIDIDIWHYAKNNEFAIVTFDSDFYDISLINGHPPKIIWIRTGNLTTDQIVKIFIQKKNVIENFLNSKDFEEISCLEIE